MNSILFRRLRRYVKRIDSVAVLDSGTKAWAKSVLGIDAQIIRSGINPDQFQSTVSKRISKKPGDKVFFLSASIFFPHRRYEDAIKALGIAKARGFANFHYNIIGNQHSDPVYFNEVKSLVISEGLENEVSFLGRVSEEELRNQYAIADVFLFPNNPQTWGLAVFEAMISGCVAVVTDGCGASEILTNRDNSLISPARNPNAFAESIIHLLTDFSEIERLSKNGMEFVRKNVSWEKYAQNMLALFSAPKKHAG